MSFEENFYILNCHSYIKTVPNYFCMDFIKDLKNEDGTFKPHVTELNTNYVQYGVNKTIKCSIPTLFIEVEYKTSDGHYLINHEVYLYNEYSTLKDLEAYKEKVSYGFASQVTQELKDVVTAFHMGYGCECLSNGEY